MTAVRIRLADSDDALGVAEVHVSAWKAGYRGLIDQGVLDDLRVDQRAEGWSRWIASSRSGESTDGTASPPHTLLVAEFSERIVGWASFGAGRDPGMGHLGELAGLYVHPDSWSLRIGHALLTRVEHELLAGGWDDGYLWVLRGNDRAIRFYENHGWNADGQQKVGDVGGAQQLHEVRHRRQLA